MNETPNSTTDQAAQLADLPYWQIADHCGVSSNNLQPESIAFLERVRDAAVEIIDESAGSHDTVTERADSSVPAYTHGQWSLFVDLELYRDEDAAELAPPGFLEAGPGPLLFVAAERGIHSMLAEVGFELDD